MITPHYVTGKEAAMILVLDDSNPLGYQRHYRCSVCGNIVYEYTQPIMVTVPGVADPIYTPSIVQCQHSIRVPKRDGTFNFIKCKTRYYVVKRSDLMELNLDAILATRLLSNSQLVQ